MKSRTFQNVIPNRMDERLVLVAINTNGKFTEGQRTQLRRIAWKRIGGKNISTHTVEHFETYGRGETLVIFENYVANTTTLRERIKFGLRKFLAAVLAYVGINPVLVVVANNTDSLSVHGATLPAQAFD